MTGQQSSHRWEHAIVIGGGLAGLLAVRVLSGHFKRVTLIERDQVAAGPEPRKGVPQGQHVHGLLLRGQQILSELFPDLVPALTAGGAVSLDLGRDLRWHHHGVWKTRFDSGIEGLIFTRPYLEWHIAERVRALPNVRIVNAAVERLTTDPDRTRIAGVELRSRAPGDASIAAGLVIDASGRGTQMPRWLTEIGYPKPDETSVKVNVMYASRLYRPGPQATNWKALIASAQAPFKKSGLIFPVEGNRWLVTLAGLHGDHPGTDDAGFLEFARKLPVPDVHQAIASATPLTPIATYRFLTNLRRHYERLSSFPNGLLVMGDAFCSFNPVYGQGMTVSALEAEALDAILREQCAGRYDLTGLPTRFHKRIARIVDAAWRLTTGEDFRYLEAAGKRPPGTALLHWYTKRMHERSADDEALALSFYRVMNMIDPPSALFRPWVMARILRSRMTADRDGVTGSKGEGKGSPEPMPEVGARSPAARQPALEDLGTSR
jgi:2-polyprenyl-6-methoxyphenol hydroxylase-like FAD-dependent oxidoreductase